MTLEDLHMDTAVYVYKKIFNFVRLEKSNTNLRVSDLKKNVVLWTLLRSIFLDIELCKWFKRDYEVMSDIVYLINYQRYMYLKI